jgi:hypothetical protein
MSNEPNVTNEDDIPVAERPSYTDWAKQVVENLVEAEKRWIELASEQNALTLKAIREGVKFYHTAPNPALADWARQGVESLLEAQKKWIDTATQQRNQFFKTAQEQTEEAEGETAPNPAKTVTDIAQQQVESLVEARKRWLDFASQQNAQFLKGVREALGQREASPATTFTDWAQQAMDNYVEVQKRWLDLATQFPFQRRSR